MAKAKTSKKKAKKVKKAKAKRAPVKVRKTKKAKAKRAVKAKKPARKAAKKTATKKAAPKNAPKKKAKARKKKQIIGEGDYAASRAFLKDQTGFIKRNEAKIPALAKAAEAALEGPEGKELRAAEEEARSHAKGQE